MSETKKGINFVTKELNSKLYEFSKLCKVHKLL